jgi:glycosyltransferase involved in cell wall biosynthesis
MKVSIIVLKGKKISDFAKERNLALERARENWVLFVDSDEKVSPALVREINNLNPAEYSGYYLKRKNYFLGKFVGTDRILRLARKNAGKWQRRVHEVWQVKGRVGTLKNPLIHQTAFSVREMLQKINFYSTLHAQANAEEGKKSSLVKVIVFPGLKFMTKLFQTRHFVFSLLLSFHSFLAWSKLWVKQKQK